MAVKMTKAQRRVWKRSGYAEGRRSRPRMDIKKDDLVVVLTGADTGKQGKIVQVLRDQNRVIVENVAMVTRHQRRRPGVLQSETVEKPAPIHRSNVMIICPSCERPTRVGHSTLPDGNRIRICHHCNEILDRERA